MTTPAPRRTPTYDLHGLLQVSGVIGPAGGAWEIFSYSLRLGVENGSTQGVQTDEDYWQDAIDDVLAFHARPQTLISAAARVTTVKAAIVNADGSWRGGDALFQRNVDVPGGTPLANGSEMVQAPQVALAVTLRTPVNTPRTRGRFYLPCPAVRPQAADGLLGTGTADALCESVQTLINDLNDTPNVDTDDSRVRVYSTFGGSQPVTAVSVGRAFDTIRSRRNALREAYVSRTITA